MLGIEAERNKNHQAHYAKDATLADGISFYVSNLGINGLHSTRQELPYILPRYDRLR